MKFQAVLIPKEYDPYVDLWTGGELRFTNLSFRLALMIATGYQRNYRGYVYVQT